MPHLWARKKTKILLLTDGTTFKVEERGDMYCPKHNTALESWEPYIRIHSCASEKEAKKLYTDLQRSYHNTKRGLTRNFSVTHTFTVKEEVTLKGEEMTATYDELRLKADFLYKEINTKGEELEKVNIAIRDEAIKIAFEKGLLQSVEWELSENSPLLMTMDGRWVLHGNTTKGIKDKKAYALLEDYFHTDYHCQTCLTFNAKIRWDDGDLSLHFQTFDAMVSFTKEHKIIPNINKMHLEILDNKKQIAKLESSIKNMETFIQKLEAKWNAPL